MAASLDSGTAAAEAAAAAAAAAAHEVDEPRSPRVEADVGAIAYVVHDLCASCTFASRAHAVSEYARIMMASGAHDLRDGSAAALLTRFLNTNLRPFPLVTTVAVMRRAQEYQRGSFKKNKAQEEQEEQRAERISGSLEADPPDEPVPGLSTRNAMAAATAVVIVALLIAYFRT